MAITIVLAVVSVLALMLIFSQRQVMSKLKEQMKAAQEKAIKLEQKFEISKDDLRKGKEELEREKATLRDAKELNKKKLRRQAMQASANPERSEAVMNDKINEESQKAINALSSQIEQLKKEHAENEEKLKAQLQAEFDKKEGSTAKEAEELKKEISSLKEDLKKQKRLLRPEGNKIDLKSLPDEAAGEFARLYRKAEQHERLHGMARAKLQLAQEKFTDLQKRYFAVCRELAVHAGKNENIDPKEARDLAENLVNESDKNQESNA